MRDTLINVYNIKDNIIHFTIPKKELEKYHSKNHFLNDKDSFQSLLNYFYVSKSVFDCMINKSEELIIDDYNFPEFPDILISFKWIKKLELYELLISEIPEELTSLVNIKFLSLKLKFLTKLPSSIFRLTNLEILKIEGTSITDLNENLFKLTNLKELHIIGNQENNKTTG